MNTPTKTGPLFQNVNELHEALVEYAQQAIAHASTKVPLPVIDAEYRTPGAFSPAEFVMAFNAAARERFAQIASALWMEREAAEERQKSGIVVDGEPLNAVEEAIYAVKFAASLEIAKAEECVRHHRMVRRLLEAARAARATGIIR